MRKMTKLALVMAVGISSHVGAKDLGVYFETDPIGIGYSSYKIGDYRFGGINYFSRFALGYKAQYVTAGIFGYANLLPYILKPDSSAVAAKLSSGTAGDVVLGSGSRIVNVSFGANLGFNLDSYTGHPLTISVTGGFDRFGLLYASIKGINLTSDGNSTTGNTTELSKIYSEAYLVGGRVDGSVQVSPGTDFNYLLGYSYGIKSRTIYSADRLGLAPLRNSANAKDEQTSGYHVINASLGMSWNLSNSFNVTSDLVGNYKINGKSDNARSDKLSFPKTSYFDVGLTLGVSF